MKLQTFLIGLAFCLPTSVSFAQLNFNESSGGDLSGDFTSPTELVLGVGLNSITGNAGADGASGGATNGSDADYFFFNLAADQIVDSITITRSGPTSQSFIGYVANDSFTGQTAGDLDANFLFSDGDTLLPNTEFLTAPLTAGNHAFWIQETGGTIDYSISFSVSAVPEPGSASVLAMLGLCALVRRKRA